LRGLPSDIRKRGRADSTAAVRAAGQAVPGLSSLLRRELGPCHAVGGLREPALMSRFFPGHAARRSEPSDPGEPAGAAVYWRALRNADRACCCPARPLLSRSCLRYPAGTTRRTCCCAVTITGCPGKRSRRRARSSSTRPACQSHRQLRFRRWPAESRWRPAAPAGCVSSPRPAWPLPGLSGRSRRAWSVPGQGGSGFSGSEHRAVARRSRARPGSAGGCSAGRCSAGRPPGNLSASGKGRSGAAGARSPRRVAPRARAWRASPGRKAHGAAVSPARAAAGRECGLPWPGLAWPGPGRGGGGHRDCPRGICGMGRVVPQPGPSALPPASSPAEPRWQQNPFSRRTTVRLLRTLAMGLVPPWPLRSTRCAAGCVRATAGFFSLPCEVRNRPPNAWRTSGPSRRAGGQTWPMSHAVGASCTGG
jgi:hypothetical protein